MATTTAFGSLSVPAPDDTMEMSSPANRNLDDDIDIDFEDYQGGVQLTDDERMLEDGEPTRPTTGTDDMMEDDMLPGEQPHIEEEVMRDDAPQAQELQQQEDEELIDYGDDDEFQQHVIDEAALAPVEEPAQTDGIGFVQLGEDTAAVVESALAPAEIPGITLQAEQPTRAPEDENSKSIADASVAIKLPPEDGTDPEGRVAQVNEAGAHETLDNTGDDLLTHQSPLNDSLHFPPPLNTALSTSTDTPGTPTDTGLHPMTVRYGDLLLPLFKSKRQPDGLLKDDNLANISLAELISNCRQRLALKIGEDISEDQELLLGFEHMGLVLVEDCRAAFECSLNDVLEVYLQLHENDGAEEVPPLSLTLSLQLKFQSSFAILKQAAAGGQGMSSFNFLHSAAGDHGDFYQEEYDDAGLSDPHGDHGNDEDFQGREYEDTAHVDNEQEVQPGIDGQYQDQYEESGEHGEEDHYEQHPEGEYIEQFGDDEFYIPEQDEASARLDELEAGEAYAEEALSETLNKPSVAADDLKAAERQAASTASSATVQGDSANTSAGEYNDDDHIDWDDDSLTPYSEQDADAHQDFSTFLTEYEDDDPKDGLLEQGVADGQDKSGAASKPQVDNHLGSEDFLHDPTGQEFEHGDHEGEHNYDGEHGAGDEAEHQEEYTFDQADTYDEQHDGYHPDYQPGDEDEFHTAHDFLNADQYEHGPEHDVYGEDGDGLDDTVGTVIHHETAEYQEHDDQEDFEEEIGFDEPDEGNVQNGATAAISGSPTGKRSFDELEEFEDYDREVKKARAA